MREFLKIAMIFIFASCSSYVASRDSAKVSDELSMKITDKWVAEDTRQAVKAILLQMKSHKRWQKYLLKNRNPKLFIAEVQNYTSDAYFPIHDMNDEILYELSATGKYRLVDVSARDRILEEITYQNDGMVDPSQAKKIGKQTGADLMVFGSVSMIPYKRDDKVLRQYSLNIRITDIETAEEVLRTRHQIFKSSNTSSFW